jgi:hypothetical protein
MNNYLKKIAQLKEEGKLTESQVALICISHDDWCSMYTGAECNCDPDIEITDLAESSHQNVN